MIDRRKFLKLAGYGTILTSGLISISGCSGGDSVACDLDDSSENAVNESIYRQTWSNHGKNISVEPLKICYPKNLNDVIDIVHFARKNLFKVKAIGSGHSFTDILHTTDILVKTNYLNKVNIPDKTVLKEGTDISYLIEAENGTKIRKLNCELDSLGLALFNMGSYDEQTIVGASSTSTHGSGITFSPISDYILSIMLVSEEGIIYRIEPTKGISDPVKYSAKYPKHVLKQDDNWFNSVSVSMGCMGIIYSVVLKVRKKYFLNEVRTTEKWTKVKEMLIEGSCLKDNIHFEVLVNPYKINGDNLCLITKRNPTNDEPTIPGNRNYFEVLMQMFPFAIPVVGRIIAEDFYSNPGKTPFRLNEALNILIDNTYVDKSYKVLNIGSFNHISGYASEFSLPMKDSIHIKAIEHIFMLANKISKIENGSVFHTCPIALRFVKASSSYLSMMYGRDSCLIEMPMINKTQSGFEMLERYERELYQFGARPHWGQVNNVNGSGNCIKELYPKCDEWVKIYKELNKNGMFENRFTDRCGYSR